MKTQKLMKKIFEIESYPISTQENEIVYIKELDALYNELHEFYNTKAKITHDQIHGDDYFIHETEGVYYFRHRTTGFTPRLKQ
mgnify:CR=1 FL=1